LLRFDHSIKEKNMHSSRWGFHPCDYQTFRKLKILHQIYQRAIRMSHAWARWKRKDPLNRVSRRRIRNDKGQTIGYDPPVPLPEPKICAVFSQRICKRVHVDKRGNVFREGFLDDRIATSDVGVVADYTSARKPRSIAAEVQPLRLSLAAIDELFDKAKAWLEKQDVN
jgi:hypothetical protein